MQLIILLYCAFVFFQALFFGGEDKLPAFLARHTISCLGIVVDPCAAILVFIVTGLLCVGIKEVCLIYLFPSCASVPY